MAAANAASDPHQLGLGERETLQRCLGSSPCPGARQLLILVDGCSRPNWEVGREARAALKVGAANGPLHHRQERVPGGARGALQQVSREAGGGP